MILPISLKYHQLPGGAYNFCSCREWKFCNQWCQVQIFNPICLSGYSSARSIKKYSILIDNVHNRSYLALVCAIIKDGNPSNLDKAVEWHFVLLLNGKAPF